MKSVCKVAVELIRSGRAHSSASARPLGGDMCKELKTKVLRLLPPTSNGPCVHQESQTDGAEILSCTAKALKEGHVVAVPTDTIYGLACLAQNSEAVRKTYDIKGRNGHNPLAICVGEIQDIYKYCKVKVKEELLRDLLPGPVTLVLERSEVLNKDLNPFTSIVGVRIPDYVFMRRLCQMCAEPLALTSANISSHTSPLAAHEFQELWPKLAVVVDGGPIGDQSRLGSTVVNLSVHGKYSIIRPGCALSSTVDVLEHKYGLSEEPWEDGPLKSPHAETHTKC
ncbi:threonylcarbamoyl-AMP synthase-like [Anarhichas minor]|uniref:threonylcarbamoyl-AMP synthase-like n=1 Tax=Anarhichas minor TaxID=65739 RepID=UPI003F737557